MLFLDVWSLILAISKLVLDISKDSCSQTLSSQVDSASAWFQAFSPQFLLPFIFLLYLASFLLNSFSVLLYSAIFSLWVSANGLYIHCKVFIKLSILGFFSNLLINFLILPYFHGKASQNNDSKRP